MEKASASRCHLTGGEALEAIEANLLDADRWALRQTCKALRARFADRTRLSLRDRPDMLLHAVERVAIATATADVAQRRAA